MEIVAAIIGVAFGLIFGVVAGWFIRDVRAKGELTTRTAAHETALANQQLEHEQQLALERQEVARLQGQLEQVASTEQLLESAKAQFSEAARLTAAEALQSNNDQFLKLANENLGKTLESASRELQQRHQQFQELVKPLRESYTKLNPQIESLAKQSQSLAAALTDNRRTGHWGEVQLRRVVEIANMTSYCDYSEQTTAGVSSYRPDMIINLPEKRAIVVDAKASTAAFLEASQSGDDSSASDALKRHAAALQRQVDDLAAKIYGSLVPNSLDFVVMFVPGDQFLSAALTSNPKLIEYAMTKRVVIVTPASLIAMLWAVDRGWQQHELAQNAERIREIGSQMHDRLTAFITRYSKVQQRLSQTVVAFNESVGSLETRVLPSARRMAELRAVSPDSIKSVPDLVITPREIKGTGNGPLNPPMDRATGR